MEIRTGTVNKKTKVQMQKPSGLRLSVRPGKTKTAKKVSLIHLPEVQLKHDDL
jgi:hypothetical protein